MTNLASRFCAVAGVASLAVASLFGYQSAPSQSGPGGSADSAPMSAQQLQALVAPIALYPDPLVAQVLSASTFPDQVAIADYWLQQNRGKSGAALTKSVDQQTWNASVKSLTAFPAVLHNMASNLTWTSSLGEAYHNQPSEVMQAIQTLRAKAKAAGNLQSTPRMTVVQQSPGVILLQPANPRVVYVPTYNPAVIYGTPYVVPGYTAPETAAAAVLGFGAGVAIGSLAGQDGWGWNSWNTDWHSGTVVYNHNTFYGNPAWHGGYYNGGYHAGYGYHNPYASRSAVTPRGAAGRAEAFHPETHAGDWSRDQSAFGKSGAFSGLDGSSHGLGGWESRANSFRGWGSMRTGGFGGGRFGGGHFGGGHFGGFHGGFRR